MPDLTFQEGWLPAYLKFVAFVNVDAIRRIVDPHYLIPGGAHTYSRGDDTFPSNAPGSLVRGRGAHVWDEKGNRFIDWGMALRSVSLGHSNKHVNHAVRAALSRGVNMTRPVPEELVLAELVTKCVPGAEMVKFGKNGSDATAAAVRLARSATGRDIILRSDEPDFLGIHDWFIGTTLMDRGVPSSTKELTKTFRYGDLADLEQKLRESPGNVAAIILEPVGKFATEAAYLRELIMLAHDYGALVIFDETVSGFRVHIGGAQGLFAVTADLSTFGKAIANGHALSALVGRRDVMELGGILHGENRTFLMSSTYGSERVGLAAGIATIRQMMRRDIFAENELVMRALVGHLVSEFQVLGMGNRVQVSGLPISPNIQFVSPEGEIDFAAKTHFMWTMVEQGILLSQHLFSVATVHRARVLGRTHKAISRSARLLFEAVSRDTLLAEINHRPVRPVFRKRN